METQHPDDDVTSCVENQGVCGSPDHSEVVKQSLDLDLEAGGCFRVKSDGTSDKQKNGGGNHSNEDESSDVEHPDMNCLLEISQDSSAAPPSILSTIKVESGVKNDLATAESCQKDENEFDDFMITLADSGSAVELSDDTDTADTDTADTDTADTDDVGDHEEPVPAGNAYPSKTRDAENTEGETATSNLTIHDCKNCSYWTESSEDMQRHKSVHEALAKLPKSAATDLYCMDCRDIFLSKGELLGHKCHVYRHALAEKPGQEVAPRNGDTRDGASDTMKDDAVDLSLTCQICDGKFYTLFMRDFHQKSVHGKLYNCVQCSYHTSLFREFDRHQRVHRMLAGQRPPFLCKLCSDVYTDQHAFQRHLVQSHAGMLPSGPFKTRIMPGRPMNSKISGGESNKAGKPKIMTISIDKTESIPVVKKELHCAVKDCTAVFTVSTDLDSHYSQQHQMSQPYGCRQCEFRTSWYALLEKHIVKHFKTKPQPSASQPQQQKSSAQKKATGKVNDSVKVKNPITGEDQMMRVPHPVTISRNQSEAKPRVKNDKDPDMMQFIKKFFFCNFCPNKFNTQETLDEHLQSEHKEKKTFDCPKCEVRSLDEAGLAIHMKFHEYRYDKSHFRCQECGTFLYSSLEFERHHLTVHDNPKPYKCEVCGFICAKNGLFKGHLKRHTRPYMCSLCSHRFAENCDLRRHMLSHQSELPFKCEVCGKGFKQKRLCEMHAKIHTEERDFACDMCDKKYHSQSSLKSHKNAKHVQGRTFMCDQCGKCYPTSGHMARHRSTHSDEKAFGCEYCGKKFKRREHLKCHLRMHTGEKPYLCKECGKRFKQICGLHAHEKIHTGEKPYVCKLCNKAFTYSSSIKNGACSHCQPRRARSWKRKNAAKGKSRKRKFDDEYDSETTDSEEYTPRQASARSRKAKKSDDFDYGESECSETGGSADCNVAQPFGCDMCDLRFAHQEALDTHRVSHGKNEEGMLHSEKDVINSLMI